MSRYPGLADDRVVAALLERIADIEHLFDRYTGKLAEASDTTDNGEASI